MLHGYFDKGAVPISDTYPILEFSDTLWILVGYFH